MTLIILIVLLEPADFVLHQLLELLDVEIQALQHNVKMIMILFWLIDII